MEGREGWSRRFKVEGTNSQTKSVGEEGRESRLKQEIKQEERPRR